MKFNLLSKFNHLSAVLVMLLLCASSNLRATDIIFTFSSADNELSVITKTDAPSGVTLTLLNPSARTTFKADIDGIAVGLQGGFITGAALDSFQLQVTGGTITLKSYTLGHTNAGTTNATFSMSGGSGSSSGNALSSTGSFNANGNWSLAPSQTGTLTATGFGTSGLAQFRAMAFAVTPVPEPSTYALGATAAGVMVFATRRRKSRVR